MLASRLSVLAMGAACALALVAPASAATSADSLNAAFDGVPLSAAELGDLRGGASFFGLQNGATTAIQIGGVTKTSHQDGSPSSATTDLSGGGTVASASATLGVGGASSTAFSRSINTTVSTSRTYSFSFGL